MNALVVLILTGTYDLTNRMGRLAPLYIPPVLERRTNSQHRPNRSTVWGRLTFDYMVRPSSEWSVRPLTEWISAHVINDDVHSMMPVAKVLGTCYGVRLERVPPLPGPNIKRQHNLRSLQYVIATGTSSLVAPSDSHICWSLTCVMCWPFPDKDP